MAICFSNKLTLYCCTDIQDEGVSCNFLIVLNICLVGLAIVCHSRLVTLCLVASMDEAGLNHPESACIKDHLVCVKVC